MDKLKSAPLPLKRKLLLTVLVGTAFFFVGLAAIFFSRDTITVLLSVILVIGLAYQAVTQYHLIVTAHYTTVDGRCIAIMQTPLRKYRNVRIVDDQDHEITLVLPKQDKVEIGHQYRFYFKDSERIPIGSSLLDASLPTDGFLGFEEISDYSNIDITSKK